MALRSTYNSTYGGTEGSLRYASDSTQAASVIYSSQVSQHVPVVEGSTTTKNPAFGHLVLGSTVGSRTYVLEPPTAPYGQRLTVFVTAATTVNTQILKASTDYSVTFDGSLTTATWSTASKLNTPCFNLISYSSQRWHIVSYSTSEAALSS